MGKVTRKKYAAEFKSRIALEVTRGELMLGGAGVETWGASDDDRPVETAGDRGDGSDLLREGGG